MVCEAGGQLKRLNLASGAVKALDIDTSRSGKRARVSSSATHWGRTSTTCWPGRRALREFASGREATVSDGMAGVAAPDFSTDGKYLYFAASTNSGPLRAGPDVTGKGARDIVIEPIENEGAEPDIEVPLDPIAYNSGTNSQLEAAIGEILAQLKDHDSGAPTEAPPLPTELGE